MLHKCDMGFIEDVLHAPEDLQKSEGMSIMLYKEGKFEQDSGLCVYKWQDSPS